MPHSSDRFPRAVAGAAPSGRHVVGRPIHFIFVIPRETYGQGRLALSEGGASG